MAPTAKTGTSAASKATTVKSKTNTGTKGSTFNNRYVRAPSVADVNSGKTTLRLGDKGDAVKAQQRKLGVKVDGLFGPITQKAMAAAQKAKTWGAATAAVVNTAKSSFETTGKTGASGSGHAHAAATTGGKVSTSSSSAATSTSGSGQTNAGSTAGGTVSTTAADSSLSGNAKQQMSNLLAKAKSASESKRPDGRCLYHVQNYLDSMGKGSYGNATKVSRLPYAKDWGNTVNKNPAAYGLKKLNITDPYKAPAGAIVVVNPGTPGTRHKVAGDIAVAGGNGSFYNGGKMSYGGSQNFPAGNKHVVGIYVPA